MEQRYATAPDQVPGMTTDDLRRHYLVPGLFVDDEIRTVYTHHDRVVLGGISPVSAPLTLPGFPEIRSERFFEHREAGIVNVGGPGTITVDGTEHHLGHGSCLYVGRGAADVVLASDEPITLDGGGPTAAEGGPTAEAGPARFYLFSAPAHTAYPTTLVPAGQGTVRELGDPLTSNRRTLNQYIHENGVRSCQVVMGVTTLHPGSMWNTMPAHTHDRRTECYLYFDLPGEARVLHVLGEPTETRHLVVADREAIIAPSWSVHSGVGTASYSFVWAMAGENQAFDDMDGFDVATMR
ncbi:5-dehydro-4-deoxy-D-glucuronate isomerase [Promicromonospora panici]|uniref:5-dehydro-4-deoxy-D-glucuronate isomerase n=1 Tax=Promicromonospora panici TaxID=2219658 RepID=UPI00101BC9CB|nr:5-dehydro-4-deoxy-D-glucuronate isomerase [Promicromonospora panici]